eukprot:3992837-Alexandrium_andersonii.AAC.1
MCIRDRTPRRGKRAGVKHGKGLGQDAGSSAARDACGPPAASADPRSHVSTGRGASGSSAGRDACGPPAAGAGSLPAQSSSGIESSGAGRRKMERLAELPEN